MEREIKFRAYFHNDKHMLYDVQNAYKGHTGEHHPMEGRYALSFGELLALEHNGMNHHTVMQFTGLLDRTGKEIWEGDIVKVEHRVFETQSLFARVEWGTWCYHLVNADGSFFSSLDRIFTHKGEVIGNIYENPELLK